MNSAQSLVHIYLDESTSGWEEGPAWDHHKDPPGITGHTLFLTGGPGAQWVQCRTGRWELIRQQDEAGGVAGLWTLWEIQGTEPRVVKERLGFERGANKVSSIRKGWGTGKF